VVTANPLAHYTGHSIATEYATSITRICGTEQFMGTSSGCEIVAHFIRHQLEQDPTIVIAKVDVKNAFNEISPTSILDVVREQLPAVLSYAEFLLALSPVQTIFNDSRERITSVQSMSTGVPQGGSLSSALFNMGQSTSIRRASLAHPAVSILLIADDTHVVGKPEDVIAAILTIRDLYSAIGLALAATTPSKNVIYGLGSNYTAAQRLMAFEADLHWIPSSLGLIVGGTPIGSSAYMIEMVNKTVDGIISELLQFETYTQGPNGTMRARTQTIFKLIQQCSAQQLTHLLRTCPPSTTAHAARRLDAAIANTIFRLTDSMQYLPPEGSIQMRIILNRLFLAVRLGGCGLINSDETSAAAYTASLLFCAPKMRDFCPTVGTSAIAARSTLELQNTISSLRARGVQCLDPVDNTLLWTLRPERGLQKRITAELQAIRRRSDLAALPAGSPRSGAAVHQALTPSAAAIRRQGITNLTCRDSGQWLNANPSFILNKMNNAAFNMAIHLRLLLDGIVGSRTHCICGAATDCFFDHALVCPVVTVRNQTRNTAHSEVSHGLRNALQARQNSGCYYVAHGEPLMDDYLLRLPHNAIQPEAAIARRADIALISTNPDGPSVTLIDVTLAAHNSQHANLDFTVGSAGISSAQRKHTFYNRLYDTTRADTALVIFAIETSGHLHSEARRFLKDQIIVSAPHNPGLEFGNILKTISVSVQTARARGILTARTKLTLDQPPTYPFVGGPLALPAPPAFLSSIQLPRHDAVPPLSNRPTVAFTYTELPVAASASLHSTAAISSSTNAASHHPPADTSSSSRTVASAVTSPTPSHAAATASSIINTAAITTSHYPPISALDCNPRSVAPPFASSHAVIHRAISLNPLAVAFSTHHDAASSDTSLQSSSVAATSTAIHTVTASSSLHPPAHPPTSLSLHPPTAATHPITSSSLHPSATSASSLQLPASALLSPDVHLLPSSSTLQ